MKFLTLVTLFFGFVATTFAEGPGQRQHPHGRPQSPHGDNGPHDGHSGRGGRGSRLVEHGMKNRDEQLPPPMDQNHQVEHDEDRHQHMGHPQARRQHLRGKRGNAIRDVGMIRIDDGKTINIGADDTSDTSSYSPFTKAKFINFNEKNDDKNNNDINSNKIGYGGVPTITFCNTTSTPLVINSYTISPDDIKPDEDVTITLHSTLVGETVTGGTISVDATVDKFPLIDETYDLCTEISAAGLKCPLSPGPYDISDTIDIPSIPISGTVDATTKLYDQSKNELACIEVVVSV